MYKFLFCLLPLFLSGCGVSVWAHNEYVTFSDVNAKVVKRQVNETKGLYLRKVFTKQIDSYDGAKKEIVINNINISFSEYSGGFVGLFPLVPPPPFIPVFFDNVGAVCPVESDVMMTIRYIALDGEQKIDEYVKLSDKGGIHLVKGGDMIISPRHVWSDGYVYRVCFPLKENEIDNTILNIHGLVDKEGREINFMPQLLHYYNDYIFAMGYLGGAPFYCDISTKTAE